VYKLPLKFALIVLAVFSPLTAFAQSQSGVCESLSSDLLANGSITSAELVQAGSFVDSDGNSDIYAGLDDFCRVSAVLSPVSGSSIGIEVWLPSENWNNKLVAVGNGGFAGVISYSALAESLAEGFAAVSTNTGHWGGTPDFLSDEVMLTDFAYRSVHEMTVAAKTLVTNYYSTAPRFTYFNGCSTGGRQALTAAQRYPDDFDGILAGAPANSTLRMTMQQLWNSRLLTDNPGLDLSQEDFVLLHQVTLEACDGLDGLEDGLIENPAMCHVDPATLSSALSRSEVEAIQKIYQGAVYPETGEVIYPGFAKGSELGWTAMVGRQPFGYSNAMQAYVVNHDPEWNFMNLDFSSDLTVLDDRVNALGMQAIDPDISEFINNGGKLLLYHGWNDPLISPYNSINYYNEVKNSVGLLTEDSVRLFMMPGVDHCQGGVGFDTWNKLQVIDDWRESGQAPDRIEASRQNEGVRSTRPLCTYPQVAVYTGAADVSDAASFQCQ
jgi:feruloyl esterase